MGSLEIETLVNIGTDVEGAPLHRYRYQATSVNIGYRSSTSSLAMFSNIGRHRLPMFGVSPYMVTDTKQNRSTWVTDVQRHPLHGYRY